MTTNQRDRLVGSILLAAALIWLAVVYNTIPPVESAVVGPRAFPLLLGVFLALLSFTMVIRSFGTGEEASLPATDHADQPPVSWLEVKIAGGLFLLIIAYGFLLERAGFRLTTMLVVVVAMVGLLQIRRPLLIIGYSAGIALGCWLVFDKLLGTHMPVGSWTSLS